MVMSRVIIATNGSPVASVCCSDPAGLSPPLYEAGNLTYIFSAMRQPKAFPSRPFEISAATQLSSEPALSIETRFQSIDGHPFNRRPASTMGRGIPGLTPATNCTWF